MRLYIETEVDRDAGSAYFDTIASDAELVALAGGSEGVASMIMDWLGIIARDIVENGRSIDSVS